MPGSLLSKAPRQNKKTVKSFCRYDRHGVPANTKSRPKSLPLPVGIKEHEKEIDLKKQNRSLFMFSYIRSQQYFIVTNRMFPIAAAQKIHNVVRQFYFHIGSRNLFQSQRQCFLFIKIPLKAYRNGIGTKRGNTKYLKL